MTKRRGSGARYGGPAKGPGHGGPANGFEKTHPPFEEGNTFSIKHGAFSERHVGPLAEIARAAFIEHAPWLAADAFRSSVEAWARTEAQITLVRTWLDENGGPLNDKGEPKPAATFLVQLERLAMEQRTRNGLDPSSAAKLHRDLGQAARSWSISQLIEDGRRTRLGAVARGRLAAAGEEDGS